MSFPWKINTLGKFSSGSIPVISLFKENPEAQDFPVKSRVSGFFVLHFFKFSYFIY
nr:MAG TPA: hypothetical protein [Caudoviricetes sp.]